MGTANLSAATVKAVADIQDEYNVDLEKACAMINIRADRVKNWIGVDYDSEEVKETKIYKTYMTRAFHNYRRQGDESLTAYMNMVAEECKMVIRFGYDTPVTCDDIDSFLRARKRIRSHKWWRNTEEATIARWIEWVREWRRK